jgi:hypothetical protein
MEIQSLTLMVFHNNINRLSSIKTLKQPIKYLRPSFPLAEGLLWPGSIKF